MKKYNRVIIMSAAVYFLLAASCGFFLYFWTNHENNLYRVEINRIYHSLEGTFVQPSLDNYEYVKKVRFLPNGSGESEVVDFFRQSGDMQTEIRPWYENGKFLGNLRFDYLRSDKNTGYMFLVSETVLLLMETYILVLLFYLKRKLIKPFSRMSELPHELAKGHLNSEISEEKGKYFGDFMRAVGRLKDTLAVSKKRELQLVKEKKMMLLSLSHDIKTPLNTIKLYEKALTEELYGTEEEKQYALTQIGKKVQEIEQYVERIMETSREDIIDIKVENSEFYLSDLMEKFLSVYKEKCRLRMVELKMGRYENCLLKGDLERSLEVLENIFENAFKYGDGGRIEISFYQEEYCRLIRIYNTGSIVTDNDINHIFESFFRGTNSTRSQGNGLGLYICREIMRKMGGEIYGEKCADGMAFVLVFMLY
ncbi:MAG: HAMP domain-containing sensor histidine kinase [Eubacteriales bacterium]|nr:HAMP domain-containing sensor histidine kinase [Eubacteriales bacterium]